MVVGDGETLTSSSKTELNNMIKNKIKELIDNLFTSIEIEIFITDKDKRVVAEHLNVCSLDIIKNANIVYFDLETSNNMKTLGTYKKFEYKHPRNNDDIFDYILHFSDGDKKYYEYYKNGIGTKVFCEKNTDISRIDKNVYDLYKKYYDLLPKNNNNSETRIKVPPGILSYTGNDELLNKLKDTDYSASKEELLKLSEAETNKNVYELYTKYYEFLSEILDYNGNDELLQKLKNCDSVSEDELKKLREAKTNKYVYELYTKYYDLLSANNNKSETRITVPSEILDYTGDDELLKKLKDTDYSVSEDELLKLRKAEAILKLFEKKKGGKRKRSSRKTRRTSKKSKKTRKNRK
jgi:hypothetical protein